METISLKVIVSVSVGALLGFGYYKLVGCRTGNCIISGNPYIATLYGGFLGYLWSSQ